MTLDLMSKSPINVYKYMLGNWRENQAVDQNTFGALFPAPSLVDVSSQHNTYFL